MEEYNELYDMLSTDNESVRKVKEDFKKDVSLLLGRIRSHHVNNIDISGEYDLDNEFEKFKVDDIFLRYNLLSEATDYKITVLQNYLQELFQEKKFNEYKRKKEEELSQNEYMEYLHSPVVKSDKITSWYQEFMQN